MTRARAPRLALLALLALPAAPAAQKSSVSDVPAGPALITGRVVHPEAPGRAAGAEVVLYAIAPDGTPGARETTADSEGRFRFDGISNTAGVVYLLGARYAGVPFPGRRIVFAPGQLEQEAEVRIAETTADPAAVRVVATTLRLHWVGPHVTVAETHELHNAGSEVVFVPGEARRSPQRAAFRSRLPEGVARFALPYPVSPEGFAREGADVRLWGPVYPGDQEVAFSYVLPADTEIVVRRRLSSGAERLRVLVPEDGPALHAPALRPAEATELEGRRYRVFEATELPPGQLLELALSIPPARQDPGALSIEKVRTFLELDDAALTVSEEHHLMVEGDTALVAPSDTPLLLVPLPPDARDVRFAPSTLALGVTAQSDAIAIQGPVPPGSSRVDLAYRLPATPGGTRFERTFGRRVPNLATFVADTGLRVDTARLHRLRPVRANDRVYLAFEAFHVAAGEPVSLELTPVPARPGLPRAAAIAFVLGATALLVAFLAAPLWRGKPEEPEEPEASPAQREREAVYASLRDLDHDYETGKIADHDYATLRGDLRARAVALLREEERARSPTEEPEAGPPRCPECGAEVALEARFCSQCGGALGAPGSPGREASG